jgi:Fe-S oxidoreductase/nitrate reductase gamma subunit
MTDLTQATRPIMWNISPAWLMYLLAALAFVVFCYGVYRRVQYWRRGRADGERLSDWGKRLWLVLKELAFQKRVRGSFFPGLFHSLLFYSFVVFVLTTALVALDYDFGTNFFRSYLYVLLTVACEVGGLFVLVGVGMAVWRRSIKKPASIQTTIADTLPLALIGAIVITGFLIEGLRIATIGDSWSKLSFVGLAVSKLFGGISPGAGRTAHASLWWSHTVLAFGWIAVIPYTKLVHLLALPTNVFFSRLRPRGALARIDVLSLMEREDFDPETFKVGIERAEDFTWKHRLDFDACVSCGRCEEICPATAAGHPFSPKQFISQCRDLVRKSDAAPAPAPVPTEGEAAAEADGKSSAVVGSAFDEDFIWYCRTCTACMEVCPAAIDHVDTMVEVRRNETMMQGRLPADAARAIKMLETRGNPFGPQSDRVDWLTKMGVRVVEPGESCDVIYWIGCCTTFDPTKQAIAQDLCRLLDKCGIEFGVLGADEKCCGDPARLLGDERLFQEVARAQVEELKQRSFKVLLVSCPHCYNVLKHEYPQFGADFHVAHHSEFLHEMLWGGDLLPKLGLARKVVYHDPCYLGRYSDLYDAPRQVLSALPGVQLSEMADTRERSRCCGGGGGHFWMDLKAAKRINHVRVEQAKAAGADTIVTACAYCKQMLDDSVKALDLDEQLEVIDLGSLVLQSLQATKGATEKPEADDEPVEAATGDTKLKGSSGA